MALLNALNSRTLLCIAVLVCILVNVSAQEQTPSQAPEEADEWLRISTELVQTDVMVFDHEGHFVAGLKPEQFELRVDGRVQTLSFFEQIKGGGADEDAQLAAARGLPASARATVRPLDRGRTIFFFVDDLHLKPDNITRTRESLLRFVENDLGQNDQAAVVTASGQLGVLQQLTSERAVMRAALKRLAPRDYNPADGERTPMSEFQALAIARNERAVIDYFVEQLAKEQALVINRTQRSPRIRQGANTNPTDTRLEQSVVMRAKAILDQTDNLTRSTLAALENLVHTAAPLPGRKLLFFVSDGFYINEQTADTVQRLPQLTDAAARSGTIIYTVNARGLGAGAPSASERMAYDPSATLASVNAGEISAAQAPLRTIAEDTGGHALLNTNDAAPNLVHALNETSAYYLLVWRPETEAQKNGKFHQLEAHVKGRNDLIVRVRRGFYDVSPETAKSKHETKNSKSKTESSPLLQALHALYPRRSLPLAVAAGYTDTAEAGLMLTASVQVESSALGIGTADAQKTDVDVAGVVLDAQGKHVSDFTERLTVDPARMNSAQQQHIVYSKQLKIAPGLYQVRVAARDSRSNLIGSAFAWLEIPDIKQTGFTLGSLFVGELLPASGAAAQPQAMISANRRFARTSRLLFQTYVYNAAHTASAPDVALQVQVFRDDQPVVTVPLRKLPTESVADLTRVSYEDDLALNELPAGRYVLQVTAIDRIAKTSAAQRVNFIVE